MGYRPISSRTIDLLLHQQSIELGGADKIIIGESIDGMRAVTQPAVVVAQLSNGVMILPV
jgi:hypothetical protein